MFYLYILRSKKDHNLYIGLKIGVGVKEVRNDGGKTKDR